MSERAPSFAEYVAICETKARYCRCLDTKDWPGYADVFTEDVVMDSRDAGGLLLEGRDAFLAMIRGALETATTVHQVHSPEVTILGDGHAQVIWAMQDRVVWDEAKARAIGRRSLTGFGHYRETYRLCADGVWRIAQSKLTRLHVDFEMLPAE
jgi:ketosteroid isomerase-like protein